MLEKLAQYEYALGKIMNANLGASKYAAFAINVAGI